MWPSNCKGLHRSRCRPLSLFDCSGSTLNVLHYFEARVINPLQLGKFLHGEPEGYSPGGVAYLELLNDLETAGNDASVEVQQFLGEASHHVSQCFELFFRAWEKYVRVHRLIGSKK